MTDAKGAGIVLRYMFCDSFSFHVRLAELFTNEMLLLLERLKHFHGDIINISPGIKDLRKQSAL